MARIRIITSQFVGTENVGKLSSILQRLRPRTLTGFAKRISWPLVPQIVRHAIFHEDLQLPEVRETTWIDGLRGWAALLVFNFHFFDAFSDSVIIGYGYDANHTSLFSLPIPRLLCHGGVAVCLFFIPAGYVCSAKAFSLMNKDTSTKLIDSLSRSVFRRVLRLYLPVACMMLMTAIMAFIGLFEYSRPLMDDRKHSFPGHLSEPQPAQYQTLGSQLSFCFQEFWELLNVFRPGPYYPAHDNHLWSVQYEFRGSMHLYIVLAGLTRLQPWVRIGCLALISIVYLSWDRWEAPLFFLGAAMAQYDILRTTEKTNLPHVRSDLGKSPARNSITRQIRYDRLLCHLLALYLMSYPIANYKFPAPGYVLVNKLIPEFYHRKEKLPATIGTLLFFYLLGTSEDSTASVRPSFLHVLKCKPARYLAHNMFAIYLVHGPLLHLFGYAMPHMIWKVIPQSTYIGWMTGATLGWASTLTITLFGADVFTREIDVRCARLINWLEDKMSASRNR